MDVSIIIPTYNRADLIRYTLDSLGREHQAGVGYEVIVVDDNSDDNSVELIRKEYPQVSLLMNSGKGAGLARNAGLSVARGEFILFLDSDDLVGKNYFQKKVPFLRNHHEVDACYGPYEYFRSDGPFSEDKIIPKNKYNIIETEARHIHLLNYVGGRYIPSNAILWRRSFLQKLGGYDPDLSVNQDVDLMVRALMKHLNLVGIKDDSKAYIRDHQVGDRVGDPLSSNRKLLQILDLRMKFYEELKKNGFNDSAYFRDLSHYLFSFWRKSRHHEPEIANKFLQLAKDIYWPVQLNGGGLFKAISKFIGPVAAVKLKYLFFKRDL